MQTVLGLRIMVFLPRCLGSLAVEWFRHRITPRVREDRRNMRSR